MEKKAIHLKVVLVVASHGAYCVSKNVYCLLLWFEEL